MSSLERRIRAHETRLAELLERRELLKGIPEQDPYDDDTVLLVRYQYGPGKTYTYAVLRVDEQWYATGGTGPSGCSWAALRDWLAEGLVEQVVRLVPAVEKRTRTRRAEKGTNNG